jgi:hypothetical protein
MPFRAAFFAGFLVDFFFAAFLVAFFAAFLDAFFIAIDCLLRAISLDNQRFYGDSWSSVDYSKGSEAIECPTNPPATRKRLSQESRSIAPGQREAFDKSRRFSKEPLFPLVHAASHLS